MKDFSGVFTALVTPFREGQLDRPSLSQLVRAQMDGGIHGFVIGGTTAESPCLSDEEKKQIFETVRNESGGRLPLVMGTGSNDTAETILATRKAADWGADAALVVVPYYNKPPQRGLLRHFEAVAEASPIPILLYNVPGRTITRLEADTIAKLSQVSKIIGIKEATGDVEFGKVVLEKVRPGFLVTSGDDGTYLSLVEEGGRGVISVASHIMPEKFVRWYEAARRGDASWKAEFERFRGLIDFLYVEANPIPVKMALFQMGIISTAEMRLPLVSLEEPHVSELRRRLQAAGML